ncbi:MAG TPA: cytochrome c-type biogenesis protein CcmH [Terracidiphilus sp.]|nr:cytochrome c-type biogenesis protein CcmH [Terracidiphilus sp.]
MATPLRLTFWTRFVEVAVLAVAICFSLGASSPSSRISDLDHRMMCQCGCAQLLGECDHVGCPDRDRELAELSADISSGMSDKEIFAAFTAKYGAVVLAAPTTHGFDLVAWIAPFAVFAAALLGTILLVRRWSGISIGRAQAAAASADLAAHDPADRERRERIRHDTDTDGGF